MSVDGVYLSGVCVRQLPLYTKLRKLSSYTLHLRRMKEAHILPPLCEKTKKLEVNKWHSPTSEPSMNPNSNIMPE